MSETADIVIIGGGIIGAACAYQIARRSSARVVVLEKGIGPGEGSTGASSAVCRYRYTHSETIRLAAHGIGLYQNWTDFLESNTPRGRFHKTGMLWLGVDRSNWAETEAARLSEAGVVTSILDDASLSDMFPAISPCLSAPDFSEGQIHDCNGGGKHLLERDGGYFDPVDALSDLIEAGRTNNVEYRTKVEVTSIILKGGRANGVVLQDGSQISCDVVVNAAGPWCQPLSHSAGLEQKWDLRPTRIQIAYVSRPTEVTGQIPVCADMVGGIYFRPQNRGQQIIVGSTKEEDEQEFLDTPDQLATYCDDDFVRNKIFALQHRLPTLETLKGVGGYSGLYTINKDDMHPIVGATPIENYMVANGFSGHGFKLAPSIGSLIAQAVTGEKLADDTDVSTEFLSYFRDPIPLNVRSVLA